MEACKILYLGGEGEIVEKKSRFIATTRPVKSEEEAVAFVEEIKKKYWDARHNCYAWVIGEQGQLSRCSDDGEPAQTAGRPMLDVLLGEGIRDACVVVTRYFGGTLLGTGGLVRAYSGAVQEGLRHSVVVERLSGRQLRIFTDYNGIGKIQYVEVSAPEEDGQTGNNADFVVLDSAVYEKASQRQLYELKVSKTKTVYTEGEAFTSSDLIVKARYADGTEEDVTKAAKLDASGVNMKKAGVYTCTVSYGGKTAVFKVTVKAKEQANAPRPTVKPPVKKKITTLQIKAKKNAKKITVKTMKKSKVKITLNKKILIKGRRKVKSITISPSKNKTGKIVLKLSKRLPKKTVIKVQVSRPGYVTKKRTVKIK